MASKYDSYWSARRATLAQLIAAAVAGQPETADFPDIRRFGKRASWYGSAVVKSRTVLRSSMAHMTSLAHIVAELDLCASYPTPIFTFTMDRQCRLTVFCSGQTSRIRGAFTSTTPPSSSGVGSSSGVPVGNGGTAVGATDVSTTTLATGGTGRVPASRACADVHRLLSELPTYTAPRDVPFDNGLYFFYERSEVNGHDAGLKIVRIGNHPNADHRLVSRLRQHYAAGPSAKNASVFRLLLGGALIRRDNPDSPCLAPGPGKGHWEQPGEKSCPNCADYEQRVTQYLEEHCVFRCVRIDDRDERNRFEALLVATVAACEHCRPSDSWLGCHAYSEAVRRSGLWNRQFVGGPFMTEQDLVRFQELVRATPGAKTESDDLSTTLLLIPCSAGKAGDWPVALPARHLTDFLSPQFVALLKEGRERAFAKTSLDTSSKAMPAIALYSGQPYATPKFRDLLLADLRRGLHCLIISGGYGLLRAEEPIQAYQAHMSQTRTIWKHLLPEILRHYVQRNGITRTFGAFSSVYASVVPNNLTDDDWRAVPVHDSIKDHGAALRVVPEKVGAALVQLLEAEYRPSSEWVKLR